MLRIRKDVYEAMITHAKEGFPLEVCGYLGEEAKGTVSRIRRMKNTDSSREHFSFDPTEQFEAVSEFRRENLKPAVVYHSHPEVPSRPSDEDIRLAYDPDVSYVIISLSDTEPVVRSFKIHESVVEEETIEIVTSKTSSVL